MVIFDRPAFKSGVMVIEDRENGNIVRRVLKPSQCGGEIALSDEEFVKAKYPSFFITPDQYARRKVEARSNAEKGKKQTF